MAPGKKVAGRHLASEEGAANDDPEGSSAEGGVARALDRGSGGGSVSADRSLQESYTLPQPLPMSLSSVPSPYQLSDWAMRVGSRLGQLPGGQSYPVLRRLLTAAVVRAWLDLAGKRLSETDDEAITGLFVQVGCVQDLRCADP
jgi:hypothetical protein